jgi:hypothetical protein
MPHNPGPFFKIARNKLKFGFFLFSKLPAAWFSGVKIKSIDAGNCTVTIPFKWLTQNPFRSTYFASLSMAAEMSTGALAMAHLYKRVPQVSMLVVKLEALYFKKATGVTSFVCEDGNKIKTAIETSISSGEGKTVEVHSTGKNEAGETVAEFIITWSFKARLK